MLTIQTQLQVNHHSAADWTKYDERLIECVVNGDVEKLKYVLKIHVFVRKIFVH